MSNLGNPAPFTTALISGGSGIEGGLDGRREPATTWQQAERTGRVEPSGFGVGFFGDPVPLIERAGQSGVDQIFLRLSWARIIPSEGVIDQEALTRYLEILRYFRAKNLDVAVVLFDGVLPAWMGPEAWLKPGTPEHFVTYALAVCEALGHDVTSIITVEEPARIAHQGWVTGVAPPFRVVAFADCVAVTDALLAAHFMVVRRLDDDYSNVEFGYFSSTTASSDLENLVLGGECTSPFSQRLSRWNPGRALEQQTGLTHGVPWVTLGVGPSPHKPVARVLRSFAVAPKDCSSPEAICNALVAGAAFGESDRVNVLLRHVAVEIDSNGRRTALLGHRRRVELANVVQAAALASKQGITVQRLILGELVDRWVLGTYRFREGIYGVDRTRGPSGVTVLETDALGLDARSESVTRIQKQR